MDVAYQLKVYKYAINLNKFKKHNDNLKSSPNCKSIEIIGGCKPLTEYQNLKSNDKTGTATIVYDPTLESEIIQIQKYLDWIKTHYGTALTFTPKAGVYSD